MNIVYPTPEEQSADILKITEKGMLQRQSLFSCLAEMRRSLGMRVIFCNMADVLVISAFAAACILGDLVGNLTHFQETRRYLYTLLFTMSPTLYLLLCLLGFWKDKLSGDFNVKMTCKYTACHLLAFRMLVFSCVSIAVNVAVVCLCCAFGISRNFWQMFLVSASGLFLFSVLFLYSLLWGRGAVVPAGTSVGWILANALATVWFREGYDRFLQVVPLYLHLAVIAVLTCLYAMGLKRLISQKRERILC